ncbi:hypothetical protein R1sor_013298 [Riccia sorocarpa]|uniref:Uncharacterized protein n=1 Tax=Riccia sorocarpa TaxID=122646 RepID=A0ABD3HC94_9MARC
MGLLPTLKGSKLAKDILPSLPTLKRRAVWLEPEFQYDGRDPPKAWLARLRQLKQIHGYSERETLKIAEKCLKGDAVLWFRIQQPHSFNSLRTGLHTRFASRPFTSVVKRKAPVQDRLHAFLSDVHVSLAPKSITSCLLPNQGRASSKVLNTERSGSTLTGTRSNSSSWKSTSRCLTPTRRFKEEKLIGPLSITAPKKIGEEKPIPTRLEHQMKFEKSSCRNTRQQVVSSPSVPSDGNVKYSKNVSYKPKKAKQAIDMSSDSNCTVLDVTKNEQQSLAVSGWKTGQRNSTRREEKDIDEFSESSEEDVGFSIVPDELLYKTNKYMGNMLQKNKDVLRLSRTRRRLEAYVS